MPFNSVAAQDNALLSQWSLNTTVDIVILLEDILHPIIIEFTGTGDAIIITDFCGEMSTSQYIASATENTFDITGSDSPPIPFAEDTQSFQTVNFERFGNTTSEPKTIAPTL